jgi:hypothetical protein
MTEMTPRQIDLARHALGLPNKAGRSYRNRFVAGEGHTDYPNWTAMVEAGHAKRRKSGALADSDDLFLLTEAGARAALKPGERLDPEDFPG